MSLFDKTRVRRWRRDVFREVQKLGFRPEQPGFSAATVMIAVYSFGTDVTALVEITGYADTFIVKIIRRLRKSKILVGQKMRVAAWDAEGLQGIVGLACDALTVAGDVERVPDPKRSAAQKRAAQSRVMPPTRRRRTVIAPGAVFSPQVVTSNPLYQLAEEMPKS